MLSRRDLFDARFQLISADEGAGTDGGPSDVDFIDAPSDLVPGVYEGGLKTWECSLDLVACLSSIYSPQIANSLNRKRILEVCRSLPFLRNKSTLIDDATRCSLARMRHCGTITLPHSLDLLRRA